MATDDSSVDNNRFKNYEEPVERAPRLPFGKEPFQNRVHVHEDDEIYNRREKERADREEREER